MSEQEEISRDEIKKEFQLERMVLFSDAVFAIVITLMAIEIKLPETESALSMDLLPEILRKLAPTVFAYCVSFVSIGAIWYQHLTMFSLLKDYDKGLVIRNLVLLFCIGLFPFCATVITRSEGSVLPFLLYMTIILMCITSQYVLFHYILVKKPSLRVKANVEKQLQELHKRKVSLIGITVIIFLIAGSYFLITNPEKKPMAILWMVFFPFVYQIASRRKGKKK